MYETWWLCDEPNSFFKVYWGWWVQQFYCYIMVKTDNSVIGFCNWLLKATESSMMVNLPNKLNALDIVFVESLPIFLTIEGRYFFHEQHLNLE